MRPTDAGATEPTKRAIPSLRSLSKCAYTCRTERGGGRVKPEGECRDGEGGEVLGSATKCGAREVKQRRANGPLGAKSREAGT